jgi:peptidyl-prolyl cis-trans isomerase B (cyclophilin B)
MKKNTKLFIALLICTIVYSCNKNEETDNDTQETTTTVVSENSDSSTTNNTAPDDSKKHTLLKVSTSHGELIIYLYDLTPLHQKNYIARVSENFFDGELFNRVVKNFVIQGGCLDTSSIGDIVYPVTPEFDSSLTHIYGAVGAGRYGDNLNPDQLTSGCQFYIVNEEEGVHFLDMNYTIFGQVIAGNTTIENISSVSLEGLTDAPKDSIIMQVDTLEMREQQITNTYSFNNFR